MNAATTTTTPNAPGASSTTSNSTQDNNGGAYPKNYQEYYQQYMQYMYQMNLYGNYSAYTNMYNQMTSSFYTPSTTTSPLTTVTNSTSATNLTNTVNNLSITTLPPPPPPPSSSTETAKTGPIKINLKYQQQPKLLVPPPIKPQQQQQQNETQASPLVRKSRFDSPVATPNVIKQQNLYQQYQQKQREKLAAAATVANKTNTSVAVTATSSTTTTTNTTPTTTTTSDITAANDIISDINKWPVSLKNYCSRLFQIYHSNKLVSEQQVTQYLQTRITETFKIKSDLNIDWDRERIPDVQLILQVSGSQSTTAINKQPTQQQQYNAVAPPTQQQTKSAVAAPQPLLSIQTKPTEAAKRLPFQQRLLNQQQKLQQQLQQQQQQVSNNKRKSKSRSKSPSSDKSSSGSSKSSASSSTSLTTNKNKKLKKEEPKIISSKLKRHSSDDDEDEDNYEEDGYESENESDEDFKPLSKNTGKFNKKAKNMRFEVKNDFGNNKKLNNRVQRFQVEIKNDNGQQKFKFNNRTISFFDREQTSLVEHRIVGTSQELEKEYLRLTGEPDPANIRPVNVLKKSLDYILDKYSKTNDYRYVCDQLKSIRQDLTVQMVRNEFTIQVYETHARIAIMKGDRDELNQCQSQLKCLYESVHATENEAEFIGYRMLYYILTKSYKDLNQLLIEIKSKYSDHTYLKHLLKFRAAWLVNNYVLLFKLYKKSNQMSKYLIDLFIERERKLALKVIIKSYRPYIKLDIIKELLAYETINKCKEDLLSYGLCITTNETEQCDLILDCKSSNIQNL